MSTPRYTDGEHWLPNDNKSLPQTTLAIAVDGGGSVVVDMLGGGKKVKLFIPSDRDLRVAVTRIYETGTTAKNIAVFYAEDIPVPDNLEPTGTAQGLIAQYHASLLSNLIPLLEGMITKNYSTEALPTDVDDAMT